MVSGKNKNVEKCPDISGMLSVFAGIATITISEIIPRLATKLLGKYTVLLVKRLKKVGILHEKESCTK